MAGIRVREAVAGDAEIVARFNSRMAEETEGVTLDWGRVTRGVRAVFEKPERGWYLVAEDCTSGSVVGQLMVTYEWSDWRNAWFWWIQSVYIRPEARGQRVYSRMYDFVKKQAAAAGNVCGFRLYVETENAHAQRVYEKVGMHASRYLMYEEKA